MLDSVMEGGRVTRYLGDAVDGGGGGGRLFIAMLMMDVWEMNSM